MPVAILSADDSGGFVTVRKHNGLAVLMAQTTADGGLLRVRDKHARTVAAMAAGGDRAPVRCETDRR